MKKDKSRVQTRHLVNTLKSFYESYKLGIDSGVTLEGKNLGLEGTDEFAYALILDRKYHQTPREKFTGRNSDPIFSLRVIEGNHTTPYTTNMGLYKMADFLKRNFPHMTLKRIFPTTCESNFNFAA